MTQTTNLPYGYYSYPEYNLTIVDFNIIFRLASERLLNTPIAYVSNYNKFDSDCKRYLLHFLIIESCNYLNSISLRNSVLFINSNFVNTQHEIFNYYEKDEIVPFVIGQFKKLQKLLPFIVYITMDDIEFTIEPNGELIEHLSYLQGVVQKRAPNVKNSRKLQHFAKQNGLINIADNFLMSSSFKKLMCQLA